MALRGCRKLTSALNRHEKNEKKQQIFLKNSELFSFQFKTSLQDLKELKMAHCAPLLRKK